LKIEVIEMSNDVASQRLTSDCNSEEDIYQSPSLSGTTINASFVWLLLLTLGGNCVFSAAAKLGK
jgi:hypothetical protein